MAVDGQPEGGGVVVNCFPPVVGSSIVNRSANRDGGAHFRGEGARQRTTTQCTITAATASGVVRVRSWSCAGDCCVARAWAILTCGTRAGGDGSERPDHVVKFFRNGFIVDDGPFRALDDPANKPFLDAMNAG